MTADYDVMELFDNFEQILNKVALLSDFFRFYGTACQL